MRLAFVLAWFLALGSTRADASTIALGPYQLTDMTVELWGPSEAALRFGVLSFPEVSFGGYVRGGSSGLSCEPCKPGETLWSATQVGGTFVDLDAITYLGVERHLVHSSSHANIWPTSPLTLPDPGAHVGLVTFVQPFALEGHYRFWFREGTDSPLQELAVSTVGTGTATLELSIHQGLYWHGAPPNIVRLTFDPQPVPEATSTRMLLVVGLAWLCCWRRHVRPRSPSGFRLR